jgi:hypothetical protein
MLYVPRQIAPTPGKTRIQGVQIGNQTYYEATEVLRVIGVSRQTLWSWRRGKLIPPGNRFRNRIVFSKLDFAAIVSHAAKIEPVDFGETKTQLKLNLS